MLRLGKNTGSILGLSKGQTRKLAGFLSGLLAIAAILASMVVTPVAAAEPTVNHEESGYLEGGSTYMAGMVASDLGTAITLADEPRLKDSVLNWLSDRGRPAGEVGQLLLARTDSGFHLDVDTDELTLDWKMRF